MSTDAVPTSGSIVPLENIGQNQRGTVEHDPELLATASKVDSTASEPDLMDLLGSMLEVSSDIEKDEHAITNDTSLVEDKSVKEGTELNEASRSREVKAKELSNVQVAVAAEVAGTSKAEEAGAVIAKAIQTLQGVGKLEVRGNELTFTPVTVLANKETQQAFREEEVAVIVKTEVFVAPESGLKDGDKVKIRDEHGDVREYTVRHLTQGQVEKLLKSIQAYIYRQTQKTTAPGAALVKESEHKHPLRKPVEGVHLKRKRTEDRDSKPKKAAETTDIDKAILKEEEKFRDKDRKRLRTEKVIDNCFLRREVSRENQNIRQAEQKRLSYRHELGHDRSITPIHASQIKNPKRSK